MEESPESKDEHLKKEQTSIKDKRPPSRSNSIRPTVPPPPPPVKVPRTNVPQKPTTAPPPRPAIKPRASKIPAALAAKLHSFDDTDEDSIDTENEPKDVKNYEKKSENNDNVKESKATSDNKEHHSGGEKKLPPVPLRPKAPPRRKTVRKRKSSARKSAELRASGGRNMTKEMAKADSQSDKDLKNMLAGVTFDIKDEGKKVEMRKSRATPPPKDQPNPRLSAAFTTEDLDVFGQKQGEDSPSVKPSDLIKNREINRFKRRSRSLGCSDRELKLFQQKPTVPEKPKRPAVPVKSVTSGSPLNASKTNGSEKKDNKLVTKPSPKLWSKPKLPNKITERLKGFSSGSEDLSDSALVAEGCDSVKDKNAETSKPSPKLKPKPKFLNNLIDSQGASSGSEDLSDSGSPQVKPKPRARPKLPIHEHLESKISSSSSEGGFKNYLNDSPENVTSEVKNTEDKKDKPKLDLGKKDSNSKTKEKVKSPAADKLKKFLFGDKGRRSKSPEKEIVKDRSGSTISNSSTFYVEPENGNKDTSENLPDENDNSSDIAGDKTAKDPAALTVCNNGEEIDISNETVIAELYDNVTKELYDTIPGDSDTGEVSAPVKPDAAIMDPVEKSAGDSCSDREKSDVKRTEKNTRRKRKKSSIKSIKSELTVFRGESGLDDDDDCFSSFDEYSDEDGTGTDGETLPRAEHIYDDIDDLREPTTPPPTPVAEIPVDPKIKVKNIVKEILDTEVAYVEKLRLIDQDFHTEIIKQNRISRMFPDAEIPKMFGSIKSLYQLHKDHLLPQLTDRVGKWDDNPRIGDIMKKFAPFLILYSEYVNNFDTANKLITFWMSKSEVFLRLIQEIQTKPECEHLGLQHHMLGPIQRVPRYELLLKEYLKKMPEDSEDREDTEKALVLVKTAASHSNEAMRKIDKFNKLLEIQERIQEEMDLILPTRELIKEGEIKKVSARNEKKHLRYIYLFNDLVLVCIHDKTSVANKLRVRQKLDIEGMQVLEGHNLETPHTFFVKGKRKAIELAASSSEDKVEWQKAFWGVISDYTKKQLSRQPGMSLADQFKEHELGLRAPTWVKDDDTSMCMVCSCNFTLLYRRHHCRACGLVVCGKCSKNEARLKYDDNKINRVCDKCFRKLKRLEQGDMNASLDLAAEAYAAKTRQILQVKGTEKGLLSGYLFMSTDSRAWQKRWFLVKDDFVLYSFKAPKDVVAFTSIPLPGYKIELVKKQDCGDRENVFKILYDSKRLKDYYFSSPEKSTSDSWVEMLTKLARAELPNQEEGQPVESGSEDAEKRASVGSKSSASQED